MSKAICIAAAATVVALTPVFAIADMTGQWEFHVDFDDRSNPGAIAGCTLKQNGGRVSGRCEDATLEGVVQGETATWTLTLDRSHDTLTFTGMLDDDDTVVVGRFSYPGKGGGSFLAVKR